MTDIEKLRADRFRFLKQVYDWVSCDKFKLVVIEKLGEVLGFDRGYTENLLQYLRRCFKSPQVRR